MQSLGTRLQLRSLPDEPFICGDIIKEVISTKSRAECNENDKDTDKEKSVVEMIMTNQEQSPFAIEQLEEALEERQTPDRRKDQQSIDSLDEDRRKQDRRDMAATKH